MFFSGPASIHEVRDRCDVTKLIIGHFHDDCLGGLGYLQNFGVESVVNAMTVDQCKARGLPIPSIAFTDSLTFGFNGARIECRYFGRNPAITWPRER